MNTRVSVEKAIGDLNNAVNLSKKFEGFTMRNKCTSGIESDVEALVRCAAQYLKDGSYNEAARMADEATRIIKNKLAGFFRNSPQYFSFMLVEFKQQFKPDADIVTAIEKVIENVTILAANGWINLEDAAVLDAKVYETFRWANAENIRRVVEQIRLDNLAKEEEKKAQARPLVLKRIETRKAEEERKKKVLEARKAEEQKWRSERVQGLSNLAQAIRA